MGKKNSKQKEITFPQTNLVACFTLNDERVEATENKEVFLDNISIDERQVKGTVALKNCNGFDENIEVKVRFTFDVWESYDDTLCSLLKEEGEGTNDMKKFGFLLDVPKSASLEFAICRRSTIDGSEIWDNCNGKNYKVSDMISSEN